MAKMTMTLLDEKVTSLQLKVHDLEISLQNCQEVIAGLLDRLEKLEGMPAPTCSCQVPTPLAEPREEAPVTSPEIPTPKPPIETTPDYSALAEKVKSLLLTNVNDKESDGRTPRKAPLSEKGFNKLRALIYDGAKVEGHLLYISSTEACIPVQWLDRLFLLNLKAKLEGQSDGFGCCLVVDLSDEACPF
jgi:hypothetical protein